LTAVQISERSLNRKEKGKFEKGILRIPANFGTEFRLRVFSEWHPTIKETLRCHKNNTMLNPDELQQNPAVPDHAKALHIYNQIELLQSHLEMAELNRQRDEQELKFLEKQAKVIHARIEKKRHDLWAHKDDSKHLRKKILKKKRRNFLKHGVGVATIVIPHGGEQLPKTNYCPLDDCQIRKHRKTFNEFQ
jgi:hypothetical protein